VPTYNTFVVWR